MTPDANKNLIESSKFHHSLQNEVSAINTFYRFTLFISAIVCIIFGSFIPVVIAQDTAKVKAADLVTDGQPINLQQEKYITLFKELREQHHFTQAEIDQLFTGVNIDKRVLELMDKQWEAKPYYAYWPLFITPAVIKRGQQELKANQQILDRIEKELRVNREIVIAIWAIESRFGEHKGTYGVFKTLNTLFDAYPRRSSFFRDQLVHFLLLCRENQFDTLAVTGSYAGAFGQTQFIPSSYREYAISFDGDKKRDVFTSTEDILASIANYLRRYHWVLDAPLYVEIGNELKGEELIDACSKGTKGRVDWQHVSTIQGIKLPPPPGDQQLSIVGLEKSPLTGGGLRYVAGYPNFQAITAWNNSNRYAMAVSELATALKQNP
ncbi:MAG: lytic murein transglycosylase [Proteobacteria bacterium]|nr:lytic murein transglycosylase [Pseudomonadota bacterium]MBU1647863.1 lytic murein transglycosylase [Pseudomonadota bacterium]